MMKHTHTQSSLLSLGFSRHSNNKLLINPMFFLVVYLIMASVRLLLCVCVCSNRQMDHHSLEKYYFQKYISKLKINNNYNFFFVFILIID